MIKKIPTWVALFLLTITISTSYVFLIAQTDFVQSFKMKTIDTLFVVRAKLSTPSQSLRDVVVVGIDDETFKVMNRKWPWGRDVHAFFLEKLINYKPKVVAFDFVYGGVGSDPKADQWWAQTIKQADNVVLASYIGPDGTLVEPHPIFIEAAMALGLVDKPRDVDGANRRTRPIAQDVGGDIYSYAAESAYRFRGADPAEFVRRDKGGIQFFSAAPSDAKTARAHADAHGVIWLSYRYAPDKFRYVSYWRIVRGEVSPEALKDKIVLVGAVSPIFHDIHPTPLGQMPGIFSNANETVAIMDRDFIWEPFKDTNSWMVVVLGIIFTILIYNLTFAFQLLTYILSSILFFAAATTLFSNSNILIDPLTPLVVFALNFVAIASWKALKTFLDNIALQRQVITDSLTGLYGHRFLTLKLGSIFLHSAQMKSEFCVAMLDADHFKKVNDTYGHDIGNVVLVAITKVMKQHVRRQDVAARFGGEEFAIVLVGTDTKGARECMERIRKSIEELEFNSDKGKFKVTISSGLVSNQNPAVRNSDDMLKLADKALYEAKTQGRNRVCAA